ncbi:MAG: hypothetical protein H0U27_06525 [Nitrosopumilus sp.]|nr:hypothetical protein [Nitrosopumilus sp.]
MREYFIEKLSEFSNHYLYRNNFWKKPWDWENFNEDANLFGLNNNILEFYNSLDESDVIKENISETMNKIKIYYDKEHDDDVNCKRVYDLMSNYLFNKAILEIDGNECEEAKYSCLEKLSYNLCDRGLDDIELIINEKTKEVIDCMHLSVAEKYIKLGSDEKRFKRYKEAINMYKLGLSIIKNPIKNYRITKLVKTAYENLISIYTILGDFEKVNQTNVEYKKLTQLDLQ